MKLDEDGRFPHPVLSPNTGDYLCGEFGIQFSVEEALQAAQITIGAKVLLTEPTLLAAVEEGRAALGFFATCLDTYFSKLITVGLNGGKFSFEPGALVGKVSIQPMLWAQKIISDFPLTNCHAEFGKGFVAIANGSLLALGDEVTINVGREKLAQMETIFSIVEAETFAPGFLGVQLDFDRIRILAAPDVYQRLNTLRGLSIGRKVVLNSVFLPAVMEVLSSLKEGASEYEGLRWHRIFTAKCQHLGISIEHAELWRDAQRLLAAPFAEIGDCPQLFGEG